MFIGIDSELQFRYCIVLPLSYLLGFSTNSVNILNWRNYFCKVDPDCKSQYLTVDRTAAA